MENSCFPFTFRTQRQSHWMSQAPIVTSLACFNFENLTLNQHYPRMKALTQSVYTDNVIIPVSLRNLLGKLNRVSTSQTTVSLTTQQAMLKINAHVKVTASFEDRLICICRLFRGAINVA